MKTLAKPKILGTIGVSVYLLVAFVLTSSLGEFSNPLKTKSLESFDLKVMGEGIALNVDIPDAKALETAGVVLPIGPDAQELPGLKAVWQEIAQDWNPTDPATQKYGFDALQAVSDLGSLMDGAVKELPISSAVEKVCRDGHKAYLLNAKGEILVVDMSQPDDPVVAEMKFFETPATSMAIYDSTLFLILRYKSSKKASLLALELGQPLSSPARFRFTLPDWSTHLVVQGNRLVVVTDGFGKDNEKVHVYEMATDQNSVTPLGTTSGVDFGAEFVCQDATCYVADSRYGLQVVNFSFGLQPRKIGTLVLPEPLRHLTLSENRLFAWGGLNRLYIIDISDRTLPSMIKAAEGGVWPVHLLFHKQHTYYFDRNGGMKVFNLDPTDFRKLGMKSLQGRWSKSLLQSGAGPKAVQPLGKILNINYQSNTSTSENVTPGSLQQPIAAQWWGNLLLVLSVSQTLELLDISGPEPKILSHLKMDEDIRWLAVGQSHAFLGGGRFLLLVQRQDNRLNLAGQFELSVPETFDASIVSDNLFLAAGKEGLLRYSISDPHRLKILKSWSLPKQIAETADIRDIALIDHRFFVAAGQAGLLTGRIDPSGPLGLTGILRLGTPVRAVEVDRDFLLLASDDVVKVIDIRHKGNLQYIGSIDIHGVQKFLMGRSSFWAAYDPERGWTSLPKPKIILPSKSAVKNTITYPIPLQPETGYYRINLYDSNNLIKLPGVHDLARFPNRPSEAGANNGY